MAKRIGAFKKNSSRRSALRHSLMAMILFGYFAPFLFFFSYAAHNMPLSKGWSIMSFGLLVCVCGSIAFMLRLFSWELEMSTHCKKIPKKPQQKEQNLKKESSEVIKLWEGKARELQTTLRESQNQQNALTAEVQKQQEEIQKLREEKEQLLHHSKGLNKELVTHQQNLYAQLREKESLQTANQQAIQEQREILEKKQQQIAKLESTVRDLTYEIKTLVQLSDITSDVFSKSSLSAETKPFRHRREENTLRQNTAEAANVPFVALRSAHTHTPQRQNFTDGRLPFRRSSRATQIISSKEAIVQLKKCIDIAQKITGSSHFGKSFSRFSELSHNSYSLDLRRLYDSLRDETSFLTLVYSQKEGKILFANNQSKELLGWSPEKLIQDFPSLVQEGMANWKHALRLLAFQHEHQVRLVLKTRAGQDLLVHCHLGVIPTGIFKNHAIGVLYAA